MNRRDFLKAVGIAPAFVYAAPVLAAIETFDTPVTINWYIKTFDYDTKTGLAMEVIAGDKRVHHAVRTLGKMKPEEIQDFVTHGRELLTYWYEKRRKQGRFDPEFVALSKEEVNKPIEYRGDTYV